ncbi:MAG: hypothetical protein ABI681_03570 [Gemmatimonadales bacterium]
MSNGLIRFSLGVVVVLVVACSGDSLSPAGPMDAPVLAVVLTQQLAVPTLDSLYSAVNNPANAGKRITIAPGIYMLDGSKPHGGRLELQTDMTLAGKPGDESAVVIDASTLSAAALTDGGIVTGAVRMGRGNNKVEWLTVRNAANGAGGITTDLLQAGPTKVTIANVVATGNTRGFDIRNIGAAAAGRVLDVVLTHNELVNNSAGAGQGMRIANLQGAKGAKIRATFKGNNAHGNIAGCLAANVSSDSATVEVESKNDRFDANGNGCILIAGLTTGAGVVRGSFVKFSALASRFEHNTAPLGTVFPTRAGIGAYGGVSTLAAKAFDNRVEVEIHSAKFSDNGGPDVAAWGAITSAAQPAGTGNTTLIVLRGSSKKAVVDSVYSAPAEAGGTNRVSVVR